MSERTTTQHLGLMATTAATALALLACAPSEDTEQDPTNASDSAQEAVETPEVEKESTADESVEDPQSTVSASLTEVFAAVHGEHPNATIIEFDDEGSHVEVHLAVDGTEIELEVDPSTFDVTQVEEESLDSDDQAAVEAASITMEEAVEIAETEGNAEAQQGELDSENGTVVFDIELNDDSDLIIDASTGEVLATDS